MSDLKRKRVAGEVMKDFSGESQLKRQVLERPPDNGPPSLIYPETIEWAKTIDLKLALEPMFKYMPRLNALTSSYEDLFERLRTFDKGVDLDMVWVFRLREAWIPYQTEEGKVLVNLDLGEVADLKYNLLGFFLNGKIRVTIKNKDYQRYNVILRADGQEPKEGETADHLDYTQPNNDSIYNLRWATNSDQILNRRQLEHVRNDAMTIRVIGHNGSEEVMHSTKQVGEKMGVTGRTISNWINDGRTHKGYKFEYVDCHDGNVLPEHYKLDIQCTDMAWYRTKLRNKQWGPWRQKSGRSPRVKVNRDVYLIHRVMVECQLGGPIEVGKEVDHCDGNPTNNELSNLEVVDRKTNMQKRVVRLITAVREDGHTTVFHSRQFASKKLDITVGNINSSMWRNEMTGGYRFRHATVQEIKAVWGIYE